MALVSLEFPTASLKEMVLKRSFVNWLAHSLYQVDSAEGGGTRSHECALPRSAHIAPSPIFTHLIFCLCTEGDHPCSASQAFH